MTDKAIRLNRLLLKLFDVRNIIGALLTIYGVLLTLAGFFPALVAQRDRGAPGAHGKDLFIGADANWWVGLVLLAVGVAFLAWAVVKPPLQEYTDDSH